MIHLALATVLAVFAAGDATVIEPETGETFPTEIEVDGNTLMLTGADRRTYRGHAVYAIAHYGAPDAAPAAASPRQAREHWIESSAPKAFILKGTRDVPARGIRWSWTDSLIRVDYRGNNRNEFVSAFQEDFTEDAVLRLEADGNGQLRAVMNGEEIGAWNDAELVRAVWAVSLGEDSELESPGDLVRREIQRLASGQQEAQSAPGS